MKLSPILNGMTNGSNCIGFIFLKRLAGQADDVSGIHSPGTNQGALSAKHAFPYFPEYLIIFTSSYQQVQLTQAETGKCSGGACCRAAAAFYAKSEAGLSFCNITGKPSVVGSEIYLASF